MHHFLIINCIILLFVITVLFSSRIPTLCHIGIWVILYAHGWWDSLSNKKGTKCYQPRCSCTNADTNDILNYQIICNHPMSVYISTARNKYSHYSDQCYQNLFIFSKISVVYFEALLADFQVPNICNRYGRMTDWPDCCVQVPDKSNSNLRLSAAAQCIQCKYGSPVE